MRTTLLLYILLLLVVSPLRAQDAFFSDYTSLAPRLNPALTGFIPGKATSRVGVTARDQWRSFLETANYRTVAVSFDHRICGQNRGDFFGIGVNLISDWQGNPSLRQVSGYLSAAFTKKLTSNYYGGSSLSLGGELGFVQHNLDVDGLTFDDQFDDPGMPGEQFGFSATNALDYGVGLLYSWAKGRNSSRSFTGGLSIRHLGKPVVSLYDDGSLSTISSDSSARLSLRWMPHATLTLPVARRKSISLSGVYAYQQPHNRLLLRGMFNLEGIRYRNGVVGNSLSVGAGYRATYGLAGMRGESLLAITRVNLGAVSVGLNYDINISRLNSSTGGAGAIELAMSAVFGDSDCLICPSF